MVKKNPECTAWGYGQCEPRADVGAGGGSKHVPQRRSTRGFSINRIQGSDSGVDSRVGLRDRTQGSDSGVGFMDRTQGSDSGSGF